MRSGFPRGDILTQGRMEEKPVETIGRFDDKMIENTFRSAGRRIMGDDAIKTANEVNGLRVKTNGELVVSGELHKIVGDLCRSFEKAMRGQLVVDIEVRLNLKTGSG